MTWQMMTRLRSMPPEELRFRSMTELRKVQGRARAAVFTPAWRRGKLAALLEPRVAGATAWPVIRQALADGDFRSAHRALARHFSARASAFPLNSADVPDVAAAIARDIPGAHEHAMARGERVLAGSYDLLGHRGLELGTDLDWHRDPVHQRRSPVTYWADVPYLDAAAGDHKIIWELNRHGTSGSMPRS